MTDEELKALFDAMRRENADAHVTTRGHVDASLEAMRHENDDAHGMTRMDVGSSLEAMRHEIRLLAESVGHLDEKLDRTRDSLEQKIDTSAAETRAMIKFSHVELDRRVRTLEESQRTLEENVSDLQARVERLESSTH